MALNYNVLIRLQLWNVVSLVLDFSLVAKTVTVFSVSFFAMKVEFTVVPERPNTPQSSVISLATVVLVFFGVWRRSSAFGALSFFFLLMSQSERRVVTLTRSKEEMMGCLVVGYWSPLQFR